MPTSYEIQLNGRLGGVPVMNRLYYGGTNADNTNSEAAALLAEFDAVVTPVWLDCCPLNYTLDTIVCRGFVATNGGATATFGIVQSVGSPGTRTGNTTSNQDGPIVAYYPEVVTGGGKLKTCHIFVPGVSEDDAEDDTISGALQTAMGSLVTYLLTPLAVTGVAMAWQGKVKEAGVTVVRAIFGAAVRSYVASQNRRRPTLTSF